MYRRSLKILTSTPTDVLRSQENVSFHEMMVFLSMNETKSVYAETEEEKVVIELRKVLDGMRMDQENVRKLRRARRKAANLRKAQREAQRKRAAKTGMEEEEEEEEEDSDEEESDAMDQVEKERDENKEEEGREKKQKDPKGKPLNHKQKAVKKLQQWIIERNSSRFYPMLKFQLGRAAAIQFLILPCHFRSSELLRVSWLQKFATPEGGVSALYFQQQLQLK